MDLLDKIRADQIQARKNRNTTAAQVLTTLLGEAAAVGKTAGNRKTTDSEVVAIVKKFLKNYDETLSVVTNSIDIERIHYEKEIVSVYLPKQMSEEELKTAIVDIVEELGVNSPKQMGQVMGAIKSKFEGQYDGKLASSIVRELLAK